MRLILGPEANHERVRKYSRKLWASYTRQPRRSLKAYATEYCIVGGPLDRFLSSHDRLSSSHVLHHNRDAGVHVSHLINNLCILHAFQNIQKSHRQQTLATIITYIEEDKFQRSLGKQACSLLINRTTVPGCEWHC